MSRGAESASCCRPYGRILGDLFDEIFDPFFTSATPPMAVGLGRSAVYGIVVARAGGIAVDTAAGVGTAIWILLPDAEDVEPGTTGGVDSRAR